MKITETRKEIIDLISDYMDKTLSEGCYLIQNCEYYTYIHNTKYYNQYYNTVDDVDKIGKCNSDRIIGHYDITAVLKYIGNHNGNFQQTYKDDFIWMTGKNLEMSISDIAIPNKPLHLYNEEEDKHLLDILIKLK